MSENETEFDPEAFEAEQAGYPLVLLEGTRMASVELPDGERATRRRTPYVDTMIEQGYVRVIREVEINDGLGYDATDEQKAGELPEAENSPPPADPPARNASRDDWAEYLAQHPGGFVTEGKKHSELLADWDAYNS